MVDLFRKKENVVILLCSLTYFVLCFFTIFTSGYLYIDDRNRVINNFTGWRDQGRPLADVFFYFFKVNGVVVDITPIPQIISILLLSFSIVLLSEIGGSGKYRRAFCSLSIFTTPFFIQNISYRFDNVIMSLAIFMAVLSVFILYKFYTIRAGFFSALALFSVFGLYQPAINIYLAISFVGVMLSRDKYIFVIKVTLVSLVAMIAYKCLIIVIPPMGDYGVNNSKIVSINDIFSHSINVAEFYGRFLWSSGGRVFKLLIIVLLFSILLSLLFNIVKKNYKSAWALSLSIPFSGFSCLGLLWFLENSIIQPRVMLGVGGVVYLLSVILIEKSFSEFLKKIIIWALFVNAWFFMLSSVSYGNILRRLSVHDSVYMQNILQEINKKAKTEDVELYILGEAPEPKDIQLIKKAIPVTNIMLQTTLDGGWSSGHGLIMYGISNNVHYHDTSMKDFVGGFYGEKYKTCLWSDIEKMPDYFLYKFENVIVIDFYKTCNV